MSRLCQHPGGGYSTALFTRSRNGPRCDLSRILNDFLISPRPGQTAIHCAAAEGRTLSAGTSDLPNPCNAGHHSCLNELLGIGRTARDVPTEFWDNPDWFFKKRPLKPSTGCSFADSCPEPKAKWFSPASWLLRAFGQLCRGTA